MIARAWRLPLLVAAMLSMTWGIWLGLLRLGWALPLPWPDQLILHGPLMIGGFLGTLIGLERAIGLARRWAYLAPLCSACGALWLVLGPPGPFGPILIALASAVVVLIFITIVWREPSLFAITMLGGALAWMVGNLGWLMGAAIYRVVFVWVAFAVLTIAGERLELNRLLRPPARVRVMFAIAAAVLLIGAIVQPMAPTMGAYVIGAGLVSVALWLARYDIARRTVRQPGLPRFIAICLLIGYVWLGIAGVLLLATDATTPSFVYDAILHAIFLGFVVSMIFGHAPIVVPAITGIRMPYRRALYVHVAVLHTSLAIRLSGDLVDALGRFRSWGGLLNAVAILLFIATTAQSFMRTRPRTAHARISPI